MPKPLLFSDVDVRRHRRYQFQMKITENKIYKQLQGLITFYIRNCEKFEEFPFRKYARLLVLH